MPEKVAVPSAVTYVVLAVGGFAIGTFGNLVGSRLLIGTGIFMVYLGILVMPAYDFLRQQ